MTFPAPIKRLPPLATVIHFIDCINRADIAGIDTLLSEGAVQQIYSEPPIIGRTANVEALRRYLVSFPAYVIHPLRFAVSGPRVSMLGATTGSHLGVPDEEELEETLIWFATVEDGKIDLWQLLEDSPAHRETLDLD